MKYNVTLDQFILQIEHHLDIQDDGSWEWTGSLSGLPGVPSITVDRVTYNVRRALYELYNETSLPKGSKLKSTQGTRLNVNPQHQVFKSKTKNVFQGTTEKQRAQIQRKIDTKYQIDPHTGCWNWTGSRFSSGYGSILVNNRSMYIHRAAYELHHNKKIPLGKYVLHACDNPSCINVEHMSVGTQQDNMTDKVKKGRLCPNDRVKRNSKLNRMQVSHMIRRRCKDDRTVRQLLVEYREKYDFVCDSTLYSILCGNNWKWLWKDLEARGIITIPASVVPRTYTAERHRGNG